MNDLRKQRPRVLRRSINGLVLLNQRFLGKISCSNGPLQIGGWPKATSDNKLRRDARGSRSSEGESWGALGANCLARRVFSAADALGLT